MSNIKYTHKILRIATIMNNKTNKPLAVGIVEEWDHKGTEVHVNVRLNENVPAVLAEAIEKNPGIIRVVEQLLPPEGIMIIPTRPPILLPKE